MESKPGLDQHLQERLYDHSVPPPAFVWPNIEKELRRRRRRFIALWWAVGLGLTATGLWASGVFSARPGMPTEQPRPERPAAPEVKSAAVTLPASGATAAVAPAQETAAAAAGNTAAFAAETAKGDQKTSAARTPAASRTVATAKETPSVPASLTSETAAEPTVQPNEDIPTTETTSFTAFDALPMGKESLLTGKRPAPEYPKVKPIVRKRQESKNCYDFDHVDNVWWIDAYAGPSITRRQFSVKNPEYGNYLQQRLETEEPAGGFNAGVRANLLFHDNFVARGGLHYDQYTEQFEWADPNSIIVLTKTTTQLVNGVWETVIDTLSIEYGDNYIKTYNRYGFLDIPLELGIELRRGRTGVSINGGASVNLLFWKRGAMLSPETNQPAYFTPNEGTMEVFKTNVGFSISGSVQWFYHLKPTLRVFAEPYYRQILKPLTVGGYPVEQSYGIGGLKIGLTKILH